MSLTSLLSIARTALIVHQRSMGVTSHNVANAMTPGYRRQRLAIEAMTPAFGPNGTIGRGVAEGGIFRARDPFADQAFRRESGLFQRAGTMHRYLSEIESAVGEPSDSGIAASLDAMFQAFADLANDPTSGPGRDLVRQAAGRFATLLNRLDARVGETTQDAVTRMRGQVDEVNALAGQIAELNKSIQAGGGPAGTAPDLQDRRDALVDRLSGLIGVRVVERPDGTIGVTAGDVTLVDGAQVTPLAVKPLGGGAFGIGPAAAAGTMDLRSGSLKALVDLTATELPAFRAKLDALAQAMVTEFNALHRTGTNALGQTNVDFFDPAGVTAGTIALSAAVQGDVNAIAAGTTGAPGDGSLALQLSALGALGIGSLGGSTMREYYTRVAGGIGVAVRDAAMDIEIQQALVDRADAQRGAVSGVNVDEEMVILISQQQAYSAAARLIRVADEMVEDLLRLL